MKYLIFLLLLVAQRSFAQKMDSRLDTAQIRIGEPLKLTVLVREFHGESVQFPMAEDTLNGVFEIIDQRTDTLIIKEQPAIQKEWTLSVYEPGEFMLKPIGVVVGGDTLRSQSYLVKVQDVPTDSTALYGNKPLIKTKFTWRDYWNKYWVYALLGSLILVALVVVLFLYLRDRKKLKTSEVPVLSPFDEAIAALKKLDADEHSCPLKDYYAQLEFIFRRYVGRRYSFDSQYFLSQDLLSLIKKKPDFPIELTTDFSQYLLHSDLVKYAKSQPDAEQTHYYRKLVEEVVRRTKPLDLPEILESEQGGRNFKPRNYG